MAHLSHEHVQHLYQEYGELKVLDDIICHRATDEPPVPILGYPRFKHSVDDYELFTGKQLDSFVDAAVKYFIRCGLEPVIRAIDFLRSPGSNSMYKNRLTDTRPCVERKKDSRSPCAF